MELDHFQTLEKILLPQPAQSVAEPAEPEPEHESEPVADPEAPPVPDLASERGLNWIDTARAALFIEPDSEGGEI